MRTSIFVVGLVALSAGCAGLPEERVGEADSAGVPGSVCAGVQERGPAAVPTELAGRVDDDGACCVGCIDGNGACKSLECAQSDDCGDAHACGHGGNACVDCDDGNPCTDDVCALAGCAHYFWIGLACGDGKTCDGKGNCK